MVTRFVWSRWVETGFVRGRTDIMKVEQLDDMMRLVGEELASFANSNVVVGSPIEFSTATVVPISQVSIALAGGGGFGQGEGKLSKAEAKVKKRDLTKGEGAAGGSTGAARVRPVAVVVFTEGSVDVLTVPDKSRRHDKLLDLIPDIVAKFAKSTPGASSDKEP
jgi:uncharacterized spore protein YtfJ